MTGAEIACIVFGVLCFISAVVGIVRGVNRVTGWTRLDVILTWVAATATIANIVYLFVPAVTRWLSLGVSDSVT